VIALPSDEDAVPVTSRRKLRCLSGDRRWVGGGLGGSVVAVMIPKYFADELFVNELSTSEG
jgi:hypothetical protein